MYKLIKMTKYFLITKSIDLQDMAEMLYKKK